MTFTLAGGQVATLFLVMMRATGLVVTAPILGHRAVPALVKAGLAAVLTIALASTVTTAPEALPIVVAAPLELLIGALLGFLLSLGFAAIEMIGRMVSLQMGLSLGSVFSPTEEAGATPIDPLFSVLAGLTFLALNLHVATVQVLSHSFAPFPLGGGLGAGLGMFGAQLIALAIELGARIALPLALVLLLVEMAVSLLARAIPQINVFILGLPAKLFAGVIVTAMALPTLVNGAAAIYAAIFRATSSGVLP